MASLVAGTIRALAALAAAVAVSAIAAPPASEQALKAVLISKLPLYIYQPPLDRAPRVLLCQLGSSGLEQAFEELHAANGSGLEVRYLADSADGSDCDLVFVGASLEASVEETLDDLASSRTVTISDIRDFAGRGGLIELAVREDGQGIEIVINQPLAERRGIRFSAQLLRLARLVKE